jgi:hypothetical protein
MVKDLVVAQSAEVLRVFVVGENLAGSVHLAHLLVLVLAGSSTLLLLEDGLAVLVKLKGGDSAVAGVDGDLSLLTVGLLLYDFLNVNASASAVDGLDLALTTLLGASQDLDLVTLADGHGAHAVLVFEVLGEVGAHHDSADAAGSGEVGLS